MNLGVLTQVADTLRMAGLVSSEREFCEQWLAKSECYMRTLRLKNSAASAEALATLGSKLGCCANELAELNTDAARHWHSVITELRHQVYEQLEIQVRARWKRAFAAAEDQRRNTGHKYLSKPQVGSEHAGA